MGNAAQYIRAKGGGLGDISAGLIRYIYEAGRFEVHVALPKYDAKIRDLSKIGFRDLDLLSRLLDRRGIHLVSDSAFSLLTDIYDDSPVHPRVRRSEAFQRHIINHLLGALDPDIVHCNDWMTGLVPAAARARGIRSVFTLHNVFTEYEVGPQIDRSGIPIRSFSDYLYFRNYPDGSAQSWRTNPIDFTATGIHAADVVNTVSPTFLRELVDGEFREIVPPSIRHAVQAKAANGRAVGILNAPGDLVDPSMNPHIIVYGEEDVLEKKRENKEAFLRENALDPALDSPLFFWPSRLYEQKGPELLLAIAEHCVREHDARIVVVANGSGDFVRKFMALATASHGRIAYRTFDEALSVRAMAAADFVLMPSRYEPCGLPQMEAPRFGTLPIVRLTGGLKDTVKPLDETGATGNGFVFSDYTPSAFAEAVAAAVRFYRQPAESRVVVMRRVMRESFERFTLSGTAAEYAKVYESLLS
jgi:ADP-glucose type glycogen/starch synthase